MEDVANEITMISLKNEKESRIYIEHPLISEIILVYQNGRMIEERYWSYLDEGRLKEQEFKELKRDILRGS